MAKIDLTKYGITGTTEIVYNPSYETLFEEETKPELEGFEKGQVSELGAVNAVAFDISAACSGFVFALNMVDAYMQAGIYKTAYNV